MSERVTVRGEEIITNERFSIIITNDRKCPSKVGGSNGAFGLRRIDELKEGDSICLGGWLPGWYVIESKESVESIAKRQSTYGWLR
jgi:hypothetical protein